jgi:hypothetical protein
MIGRILCAMGFHRMLHVGGWRIDHGSMTGIDRVECSRCHAPLDWLGRKFQERQ